MTGNFMEILRYIFNFLTNGQSGGNFDLKNFLNGITPKDVSDFLSTVLRGEKNPAENYAGLTPIADMADRDIVFALNRYFAENY